MPSGPNIKLNGVKITSFVDLHLLYLMACESALSNSRSKKPQLDTKNAYLALEVKVVESGSPKGNIFITCSIHVKHSGKNKI
jgi:hypothetical protein